MKLGLTLLVRDEMDILSYYLEYHIPKVDMIVVTDNGSVDGTREFLRKYESENFIVIDEPNQNYQQSAWVTRMINLLKNNGCDWVVNSDADEFWTGDIRKEIELAEQNNFNCIFVNSFTFVTTYMDDFKIENPILRHLWRFEILDKYPKVICSTNDFNKICHGNDEIEFHGNKCRMNSENLLIFHYQQRGLEHCKRKYINGGKAIEESQKTDTPCPSCWLYPYKLYKESGMDAFLAYYKTNLMFSEESFKRAKLVKDTRLYDELQG